MKKVKVVGHEVVGHKVGIGCDAHYNRLRKERECSCGRPGVRMTEYGSPICDFHASFRKNEKLIPFAHIPCPGPHI